MSTVFFNGQECHTCGMLPAVGTKAPDFTLVTSALADISLKDFAGKRVVLNIFPSLDTEVCARSVRRFNEEAAKLDDTVVVCVSEDLPFAMTRFCSANGIKDVIAASAFRNAKFAEDYGVMLVDGPLKGLLARSVVVIDNQGEVVYAQLVDEITKEPDYDAALKVLKGKY